MQALTLPANQRIFEPSKIQLSLAMQVMVGAFATALFVGSFLITGSLVPIGALIGLAILYACVRNPIASIFTFIVLNVILAVRTKTAGQPSDTVGGLDLAIGLTLISIIGYWFLRIRLIERSQLSMSVGQLAYALFMAWSVFVTAVGLFGDHSSLNDAIRELLNLSPLLILPVLYARYVEPNSKGEGWIFGVILTICVFVALWNIIQFRHNYVRAYYLYQVGRANTDDMLSVMLVVVATSFFMSFRKLWQVLFASCIFLIGILVVVISLRRSLYIVVLLCVLTLFLLASPKERWQLIKRLLLTSFLGIICLVPFYLSSKILRVMLIGYWRRFLSSQHIGTDLSLVNRYVEWKYEWQSILQSPILGHGFGSRFRAYNIILHFHDWMGFSHSSYLFMIFKSGFLGFILFFLSYIIFLVKGFHLLRYSVLTRSQEIIVRSATTFLLALLINAYTEPVFDSKTDLVWAGIVWGYFLTIGNITSEKRNTIYNLTYD